MRKEIFVFVGGETKLAVAICANAHPRTVMNMIPRHLGDHSLWATGNSCTEYWTKGCP